MKKNRPGISLQVLVDPQGIDAIVELLLRETSTFGVKVTPCRRYCLRRKFEQVVTPHGTVKVKIGYWSDDVLKVTPEYEDCRRLARERNVPLAEVFAAAHQAIRESEQSRRSSEGEEA
jgi:uncharacterized protein (DUF111 family)